MMTNKLPKKNHRTLESLWPNQWNVRISSGTEKISRT